MYVLLNYNMCHTSLKPQTWQWRAVKRKTNSNCKSELAKKKKAWRRRGIQRGRDESFHSIRRSCSSFCKR